MKHRQPLVLVAAALILALGFLLPLAAPACSTFKLQHGNELIYGHNLNANGIDVPGLVFVNKRGIFKTGRSWSQLSGRSKTDPSPLAWISRFGSVTFNTFGKDLPDGGMNEAGLYIWEMGLGNAEVVYPRNSSLPKLNQMHWMQYVLDNSSTVDEAVRCASIDFDAGLVVVHQDAAMPVPGLFNTLYAREVELARYFRSFGGTYEPRLDDPRVPRYVKTAIMLKEYDASRDAVAYGFQVLKNLTVTEAPDWSVLFDVRRRVVHFKTSLNPQVKHFAIRDLDFANTAPVLILDIDIREGGDVGARFGPFNCEAMAGFIAALPLPAPFWEMGGLRKEELVERLATHTAFAQEAANQPFAGRWQAKPGKPGEKPGWEICLFCKGDAVFGEISGPEKLAERTALEHIRLVGGKLAFTFKSRGAGNLMEARADIGPAMMTMELWGLEDPVGCFELFRQPPDLP